MIPRVIIISRNASVESINGAGGSRGSRSPSAGVSGGRSPLRNFLGSKEHQDWLKINLNAAEIITVQDYKCTKH